MESDKPVIDNLPEHGLLIKLEEGDSLGLASSFTIFANNNNERFTIIETTR